MTDWDVHGDGLEAPSPEPNWPVANGASIFGLVCPCNVIPVRSGRASEATYCIKSMVVDVNDVHKMEVQVGPFSLLNCLCINEDG